MESFLSTIDLPCLSEEDRESMKKPFSSAELLDNIKSLPVNKSPGDDDFFIPLLMEVFEQSRRNGCFPDSFSQAVTTVIQKKGKTLKSVPPTDQSHTLTKIIN